jgi:peptidyl-prolyl cis-trans isomerase SurA
VDAVAKELPGASAVDLGTIALNELPKKIASAVKDLAVGQFSQPIGNKTAVMMLMVCKREQTKGKGPNRETVSNSLAQQRLAMLAQRYLRDLRRSAVVELR